MAYLHKALRGGQQRYYKVVALDAAGNASAPTPALATAAKRSTVYVATSNGHDFVPDPQAPLWHSHFAEGTEWPAPSALRP
ncbi:hypothetical protein [Kribbella solani]|uniref:hypothetical protein n=1 Tax=Kribbella solani TaxID=236067 RepID=UPI0029AD13FD|nr:hypothetical protein [Kribbella solani]MDX2974482.1 hypothetical protein [Kribbella solani]